MKELNEATRLYLRLQDSLDWSARVRMAGQRILDYVPTYSDSATILDMLEVPGKRLVLNYVEASQNMRSEVYFFTISFANYLKSLNRLGANVAIERFQERKILIKALRNVYEHWEKHDIREWQTGKLNEKSQRNYQVFVDKFPNSPGTAHWFIETKDGDLLIASTIRVRNTLKLLIENDAVINAFIDTIFSDVDLSF